eukprot:TRINITY_DN4272_c0_g1_i4.p1 TRINITY_DN4272_c0_g1~~TRINITY_DN4272_c0_g1_i4.p1  ORF type:complete len:194 (+),score=39.22 TRINITY_DN4272_c0_g1_i4:89-583(+)
MCIRDRVSTQSTWGVNFEQIPNMLSENIQQPRGSDATTAVNNSVANANPDQGANQAQLEALLNDREVCAFLRANNIFHAGFFAFFLSSFIGLQYKLLDLYTIPFCALALIFLYRIHFAWSIEGNHAEKPRYIPRSVFLSIFALCDLLTHLSTPKFALIYSPISN